MVWNFALACVVIIRVTIAISVVVVVVVVHEFPVMWFYMWITFCHLLRQDLIKMLVGNKIDKEGKEVSTEEGKRFAKRYDRWMHEFRLPFRGIRINHAVVEMDS